MTTKTNETVREPQEEVIIEEVQSEASIELREMVEKKSTKLD